MLQSVTYSAKGLILIQSLTTKPYYHRASSLEILITRTYKRRGDFEKQRHIEAVITKV